MAGRPSRRGSSLGRRPTTAPGQLDSVTTPATVPQTNKDPVWSLCPWSVEVPLGEVVLEIPPLPAVTWLQFLLTDTPDLDGMIATLMPEVEDYVYENELPFHNLYKISLGVFGIVAARPWWVALRIIAMAAGSWHILGPKLMISGVDARELSLAAWLDLTLYLAIESMDPKKVTMFSLKIEAPPPGNLYGLEPDEQEAIEGELVMSQDAFLAMS